MVRDAEVAPFDPIQAGWQTLDVCDFVDLVGPVWWRSTKKGAQYGLIVADKHSNRSGLAHGGVFTSLLDTALGLTAHVQKDRRQATISLDVQFLAPARIGEFLIAEGRIVKSTRSIIFMQGTLCVGHRVCAIAQGTWKVLDASGAKNSVIVHGGIDDGPK